MGARHRCISALAFFGAITLLVLTIPAGQAGASEIPAASPTVRIVEFVHGINGNFRQFECSNLVGGFGAILAKVCGDSKMRLENFAYYQDEGYEPATGGPCKGVGAPDTNTGLLYVDPDSISTSICDSKGALAYSAAALDAHLAAISGPVTVVANSMGGAITRGWLALANFNGPSDKSLAHTDSVIFLQGAQAGSWAAAVGEGLASNPQFGPLIDYISHLAKLDLDRPGVMDVVPQSPWYDTVNQSIPSPGVPSKLAYYNFYSNLTINLQVNFGFFTVNTGSFDAGDLVMLPGSDNPAAEPALGGARFLPGGAQTPTRHEFGMNATVNINPLDLLLPGPLSIRDILRVLGSPVTHFNLPGHTSSVDVTGCGAGSPTVTVMSEVFRILQNPTRGCA
jgi:hypothetical protein